MPELPAHAPAESRDGQVVTFYSYKGGTGRTMALANVAWILAANGLRVLVADWDLESPGLHRFFHPFLDEADVRNASGIIDLIRQYAHEAHQVIEALDESKAGTDAELSEIRQLIPDSARVEPHAISLNWVFPEGGCLDFLSPGRQNFDYAATLAATDWDNFYERLHGGEFLDALRADMKARYDYVLIDSRTGLSDIAGICTVQLPDVLIDCFTLSTQGIEGGAEVARSIEERHHERGIRILPVPMRVDPGEKEKVEAGHAVAVRLFANLPGGMTEEERRAYWAAVEVPYRAFYAYEETLAVFGDAPGFPTTLLAAFERLADKITEGAVTRLRPMDEQVRNRTRLRFTRRPPLVVGQVTVEFRPEDEVWGEWIGDVLRGVGVRVTELRLRTARPPQEKDADLPQTLTVVSARYVEWYRSQPGSRAIPRQPVYVTSDRPTPEFSAAPAAFISGVTEQEAITRLLRLVGITSMPTTDLERSPGIRFPGEDPPIYKAPAPNDLFTGREEILRDLRELLRDYGAASRPVVLSGFGGVGKTQIALEYVNRFKTDYDVVFWIDCSQPQFIDGSLWDLAKLLQASFDVRLPVTAGGVTEAVRIVLQVLSEGKVVPRWLLVFDNAEDIAAAAPYLPRGGHVLITSRSRDWPSRIQQLQVDLFTPEESIAHLHRREPSIGAAEAGELAAALGYLPVGVALAGAWLAESGHTVPDYLVQLESRGPSALTATQLPEYPLSFPEVWEPSLTLLRQRSPAAARLFELCSVMAPAIALDILYSPAMAAVLEPFDPAMAEPEVIGTAIREIDKLALIKLDRISNQVVVHLLVQSVVRADLSAEQLAQARRDVHRVLVALRPPEGVDDSQAWDRYRLLWPHLRPSRASDSAQEHVRQLLIDRVRYLRLRSDLERGRTEALEYESAWQAQQNPALPVAASNTLRRQLLRLQFNLANILRDLARYEEAMALDEQVLDEQRELLGPTHPHTLTTTGSLAGDLRALGRYRESLEMDTANHQAWIQLYGEGHPRTLAAASNLADSYRLTGSVARALQLDEVTLDRRQATLGPSHHLTFYSASNLVRDLLEAGRYAVAADRIEAVWRSCVTAFGDDSIYALNAQILLGVALRSAGRSERAEEHFVPASARLTAELGATSTDALAARLSHALNLLALGRAGDARAHTADVREVYESRLGPAHPHTLVCQLDLACALRTGVRDDAAMQAAVSASDGLREVLGFEHPYALAAHSVLGVLLADQKELASAEKIEAQVVERLSRALDPYHPDTLRCRANLLLTRIQLGVPEARAEREQVIADLVPLLGADHPHIAALGGEGRLLHTLDPQPF